MANSVSTPQLERGTWYWLSSWDEDNALLAPGAGMCASRDTKFCNVRKSMSGLAPACSGVPETPGRFVSSHVLLRPAVWMCVAELPACNVTGRS